VVQNPGCISHACKRPVAQAELSWKQKKKSNSRIIATFLHVGLRLATPIFNDKTKQGSETNTPTNENPQQQEQTNDWKNYNTSVYSYANGLKNTYLAQKLDDLVPPLSVFVKRGLMDETVKGYMSSNQNSDSYTGMFEVFADRGDIFLGVIGNAFSGRKTEDKVPGDKEYATFHCEFDFASRDVSGEPDYNALFNQASIFQSDSRRQQRNMPSYAPENIVTVLAAKRDLWEMNRLNDSSLVAMKMLDGQRYPKDVLVNSNNYTVYTSLNTFNEYLNGQGGAEWSAVDYNNMVVIPYRESVMTREEMLNLLPYFLTYRSGQIWHELGQLEAEGYSLLRSSLAASENRKTYSETEFVFVDVDNLYASTIVRSAMDKIICLAQPAVEKYLRTHFSIWTLKMAAYRLANFTVPINVTAPIAGKRVPSDMLFATVDLHAGMNHKKVGLKNTTFNLKNITTPTTDDRLEIEQQIEAHDRNKPRGPPRAGAEEEMQVWRAVSNRLARSLKTLERSEASYQEHDFKVTNLHSEDFISVICKEEIVLGKEISVMPTTKDVTRPHNETFLGYRSMIDDLDAVKGRIKLPYYKWIDHMLEITVECGNKVSNINPTILGVSRSISFLNCFYTLLFDMLFREHGSPYLHGAFENSSLQPWLLVATMAYDCYPMTIKPKDPQSNYWSLFPIESGSSFGLKRVDFERQQAKSDRWRKWYPNFGQEYAYLQTEPILPIVNSDVNVGLVRNKYPWDQPLDLNCFKVGIGARSSGSSAFTVQSYVQLVGRWVPWSWQMRLAASYGEKSITIGDELDVMQGFFRGW